MPTAHATIERRKDWPAGSYKLTLRQPAGEPGHYAGVEVQLDRAALKWLQDSIVRTLAAETRDMIRAASIEGAAALHRAIPMVLP